MSRFRFQLCGVDADCGGGWTRDPNTTACVAPAGNSKEGGAPDGGAPTDGGTSKRDSGDSSS